MQVGRTDTRWSRHAAVVSLIRVAGSELSLHVITPLDRNYLHPDASPQRAASPNKAAAAQNTPEMSGTLRKGAPGRIDKGASSIEGGAHNGGVINGGTTTPRVSRRGGTWKLRKRRSASKDRKRAVANGEHSH